MRTLLPVMLLLSCGVGVEPGDPEGVPYDGSHPLHFGPDSGTPPVSHDGGVPDAGRLDAGFRDAGPLPDAGHFHDAGTLDAGLPDAGIPDAGAPPDAGPPHCGALGEACCVLSTGYYGCDGAPAIACDIPTTTCKVCGGLGQPACHSGEGTPSWTGLYCAEPYYVDAAGYNCTDCGGLGDACCAEYTCNFSHHVCLHIPAKGEPTCRTCDVQDCQDCGEAGQRCCLSTELATGAPYTACKRGLNPSSASSSYCTCG